MNEPRTASAPPSRRRLFIIRGCVILFLFFIIGGAWLIYYLATYAMEAEENFQATVFVLTLIEHYVDEHHKWPASWQELERLPVKENLYGREYDWPRVSSLIQRRVTVDFHMDLAAMVKQDPNHLQAVQATRPCFEYGDFAARLQKVIAKHLPQTDPGR